MGTVTSLAAHRRAKQHTRAVELAVAAGHPSALAHAAVRDRHPVRLGHGRVAHLARLLVPVPHRGETVAVALCGVSSPLTRPPGDLRPCRRCLGT